MRQVDYIAIDRCDGANRHGKSRETRVELSGCYVDADSIATEQSPSAVRRLGNVISNGDW